MLDMGTVVGRFLTDLCQGFGDDLDHHMSWVGDIEALVQKEPTEHHLGVLHGLRVGHDCEPKFD